MSLRCVPILAWVVPFSVAQTPPLFETVTRRHLPQLAQETAQVLVRDLDGDGKPDVFLANSSGPCGLRINRGQGILTDATAQLPAVSGRIASAAAGDVDGDGDVDLVVAGYQMPILLLLNNGTGRFADVTVLQMPGVTVSVAHVALADLDRDGDLDVVAANGSSGNPVLLYTNNGRGRFTDASTPVPGVPGPLGHFALLDADADGDLDLVALTGSMTTPLRLLLNAGNGTFSDATTARLPALPQNLLVSVATADVNQDGFDDILAGSFQTRPITLLLGSASGVFADRTATNMPTGGQLANELAVRDIDGDGRPDVAVASLRGVRVLRNVGLGVFSDQTAQWVPAGGDAEVQHLVLADLDQDGTTDAYLGGIGETDSGSRHLLYLGDARGRWVDATARALPDLRALAQAAAVADLDGDGAPDVILGDSRGRGVRYLRNDGRGGFSEASTPSVAPGATTNWVYGIYAVDLDGDRDRDVLINQWGNPRVWLNNGAGVFSDVTSTHLPAGVSPAGPSVVGDLDGDGTIDFLVATLDLSPVQFVLRAYRNGGAGRFTELVAAVPALPQNLPVDALALFDVDGDRDLDLVVAQTGEAPRLLLNNGAGVFSNAPVGNFPILTTNPSALLAVDIDGDGDLDLVLGAPGQDLLLLNNGAGVFTDVTGQRMPPDDAVTTALAAGDFDLDGRIDLLLGSAGTTGLPRVRCLWQRPDGRFVDNPALLPAVPTTPVGVLATADFDRDGDLDVLVGPRGANGNLPQLWSNRTLHLTTPYLARVGRPWQVECGRNTVPMLVNVFLSPAGAPPVAVPNLGILHLAPTTAVLLGTVNLGQSTTNALTFGIPADATLVGAPVMVQGLTSLLVVRLTNAVLETIGQ